jgi:hypothetical protein
MRNDLNWMACPIHVPLKACRWLRFAFVAIVGRAGFARVRNRIAQANTLDGREARAARSRRMVPSF